MLSTSHKIQKLSNELRKKLSSFYDEFLKLQDELCDAKTQNKELEELLNEYCYALILMQRTLEGVIDCCNYLSSFHEELREKI